MLDIQVTKDVVHPLSFVEMHVLLGFAKKAKQAANLLYWNIYMGDFTKLRHNL